ncbi:two-component system, chemotaxis family, response regulator CheY/two-component system, NtrC family, nitrogen regulation response regulator GlnG [Mariprofundus ferrinatatus]|uniref:Two-component system, chemotaxis family, response regulator CheY/two-component system, NtrC family, nitrogen regulation response regulator GlnG n=1 Tax=Mariprofundus ferrinatatus TaxID=1921087 RepID=A0A2K8LBE7_9PROT|nr:response regulator [Mariprofundus ferrinatatus]ATX81566.1 two-component system, chemotaxis family, response regulator CheY/two-component system, NtrC family, nitrogen regulation response regulator GlnG [Mariprofundus ferrinatatus]
MEVLIVDDLEHSRVSLARIVAHFGCVPVEALGAKDAIEILARRPEIGVVLLRSRKSAVNGYNLLSEMKSRPKPPKVVVVGKEEDMPSMLKMLAEGADEYIIKPYDSEAIARKMRSVGACC